MQDLAIVGLGLIGSAALRHAAEASASVVGIGPAEPQDWTDHDGPFASHYDSGRVTRRLDARLEWAILASRSIAQYQTIEARSGIEFHRPTGLAFVRSDEDGIANLGRVAAELDIPTEIGPVGTVLADVAALHFPESMTVIREPGPAGAIDPRRMIEAQHRAAIGLGALVARDVVVSIRPSLSGFELLTAAGRTHQAANVLLAAGAYSNRFLSAPLSVGIRPEVVAMGEIDDASARSLDNMPSIIHLVDHPALDDVYVVPPARYPDGRWYIKIGGSQRLAAVLDDDESMNRWMGQGQADAYLPALQETLTRILPAVDFRAWRTRPCLITDTASRLPYIDTLESGITVAFGGNGHAAKSADAIGALDAGLALERGWSDGELDHALFTPRFDPYEVPTGSRHGG
ncbi:MAG: NAD(P)/FAD-dependent oxidoreductase [Acidimicrobiales bacterium]